jgi:hypothetical protein
VLDVNAWEEEPRRVSTLAIGTEEPEFPIRYAIVRRVPLFA